MAPGQFGHDRRNGHLQRDLWHVETQQTCYLTALGSRSLETLLDLLQCATDRVIQSPAHFRQCHAASRAGEQGRAQPLLYRPDGMTDRRWTHPELMGCR